MPHVHNQIYVPTYLHAVSYLLRERTFLHKCLKLVSRWISYS